jgi:hypothetical protein
MEHRASAMLSEQSLSIFSGILSGPHALLGFMLLKSLAAPFVDTDISGRSQDTRYKIFYFSIMEPSTEQNNHLQIKEHKIHI